ncbi:MAG: PAC2 family protein [bacterium]
MQPEIKIYKRLKIKEPVMIAAWPGIGNVALGAIDYLQWKLKATPFAEIEIEQLVAPELVIIEQGIAKFPPVPKNVFYYHKDLNLLIFESEAQLKDLQGLHLMLKVLDFAKQLEVQRIYTAAAFPVVITHKDDSLPFCVGNNKSIRDYVYQHGIEIMKGGQISGLNGLLLSYAGLLGIEAACILASIPQYMINFPNPKASKVIIETLGKLLNFRVEMTEINLAIQEIGMKMDMIEDKIKGVLPGQEEKKTEEKEHKVPDNIMEKIEKLFEESKQDKQKAHKLKEELDRWNLYNLYEDRFLDLFRKEGQ